MSGSLTFTLRPARSDDVDLAAAITEDAMREYVEATWGAWDADVQRENSARSFSPATHQFVMVDGAAVGLLALDKQPTHLQLEKLYLLRAFRNRGLGAQLLQHVLNTASACKQPVRLRVLAVNVGAQRFYERHGFRVFETTAQRRFMEHCG